MKRRWKQLPTRWKKRVGAARMLPKCWESVTRRCFIRCGNLTWIRPGRGKLPLEMKGHLQPSERRTARTSKKKKTIYSKGIFRLFYPTPEPNVYLNQVQGNFVQGPNNRHSEF